MYSHKRDRMPHYSKYVWKMCQEAAKELDGEHRWLHPSSIKRKVKEMYPSDEVNENTIYLQILCHTINMKSRKNYPSVPWKKNPLFVTDGRGRYKLLTDEEKKLFLKNVRAGNPVVEKDYYSLNELGGVEDHEVEDVVEIEEDEETVEERYRASISLERDLHEYILHNLDFLEEGLQPYEGRTGSEYSTDAGRIDILAVDRNDDLVVIEIKTGMVRDKVMGQIMRYVGYVKEHIAEETQDVRAIIVAEDFDKNLKYSKSLFPGLELKQYEVSFEFTEKGFPG